MKHEVVKEAQSQDVVQIIPLGGVEEIGINCTVLRANNKIIIVDAGLGFSDVDHLGIDYLIPNYDYLVKNKHLIEGIFITHGHLDHIGAVEHFLKTLDYPDVFASKFAMELIKSRLNEAGILPHAKLHEINRYSILKSEPFEVQFFHVNHSIPESMGVIVDTPVGKVVFTGDFKFDNSPLNEDTADFYKMAKTGNQGVRLLLSDSTNSFHEGHSISEYEIMRTLEAVVKDAEGRVVVATFASLVTRLYALVEIAKRTDRKIFITGRSMANSINIARKLNYINAKDDLFVDNRHVNRFSDKRLMVLATGSQGESMAALSRMARGEHREVKLKKGDTVMLSSSIIPGNDALVQNLIDQITSRGAKVFHKAIMNLHTSGHGFIEDQKMMINLFKPQLFMPVHGYQYFLRQHGETAKTVGIKPENIILSKRGEIIELTKNSWRLNGRVKHDPILISGLGIGDVGPVVLQDREQLANSGVVVLSMVLFQTGKRYRLAKDPYVFSRGFVFVKNNQELIKKTINKAREIFEKIPQRQQDPNSYRDQLRTEVEKAISNQLYNFTERTPLIIVNIEFIDQHTIQAKQQTLAEAEPLPIKPSWICFEQRLLNWR